MNYDPAYLNPAFCVAVQNKVKQRHDISIYSVRLSCRQNVELLTMSITLRFQYEVDDRMVNDCLELSGFREDVMDTTAIADKIANKIKSSTDP